MPMSIRVDGTDPAAQRTVKRGFCERKRMGFSWMSASMISSEWPRRRISIAVFGTASGSLRPQSQALFSQTR